MGTPVGQLELEVTTNASSATKGINDLASSLGKLKSSTKSVDAVSKSFVNLSAKVGVALVSVKKIANVISGWISESNSYIESMNLFNVSMGEYAESAKEYALQVEELMGIDSGQFMRNQGVFMTLAKGFGVAGDRASVMSQNLTQLGYDLASFENDTIENAMMKLQSGIAGELEPLRRYGYDLSNARLQQEAFNLGITKSVSAMTQAEKAELRYYAIMTQVTWAQGDMARTIEQPANQLRILRSQVDMAARSLGNIFLPALQAIVPVAIAVMKVIRMLADLIAGLMGFEITDFTDTLGDSISVSAGGAADLEDNLGGAAKKAKEVKNALLGIDELNIISPPEDTSGSGGGADYGGGGGLGFELPTYDFLKDIAESPVNELVERMREWLGITDEIDSWAEFFETRLGHILTGAAAIGGVLAAWKLSDKLMKALQWLTSLKDFSRTFSFGVKIMGVGWFIDAWSKMKEAIQDILSYGANFDNVTLLISGFLEGLGAALVIKGEFKAAGVSLLLSGVLGIIRDIKAIVDEGQLDWDTAMSAINNIGLIISAIGLLQSKVNWTQVGVGAILTGLSMILGEVKDLLNAFETGDFSNVDWITLAGGAILAIGGLITTFKTATAFKERTEGIGAASEAVKNVTGATEALDTNINTGLSPKLTSLVKNIGIGIAILAEVAAAAILFVGAIWVLGLELEQVGIAWQPVIDNAGTVAIAIGVGTGLLVAIGVVTAALGTLGGAVCGQIAIGIAILAELGVAAGLFIVEIWAIGKGLDEIGKAWQPVLDNGETIATGIGLGTALLVGIGVVTAALGVATVASAGLLPLAIGLGTALLVELAAATILFIESLVAVSKELGDNLAPALDELNGKLPALTTNMSDFVDFMTAFAGEVVRYTGASAVAGISATIDTIIGWFTQDPIEKLANDVDNIAGQASDLNDKLNVAVPELETAVDLLSEYVDFIDQLGVVAGSSGTVNLSEGLKTNLNTVGQNIVTGFNDGVKSKYSLVQSTMTTWGTDAQKWFNNSSYGGVNKEKWQTYANDIVNGFKDKISSSYSSSKSSMTTWATNVKNWFTQNSYGGVNKEKFAGYAKDVIDGFSNKISTYSSQSKTAITTWASNIVKWFKESIGYNAFYSIAKDVIDGFNKGINDYYDTTEYYMRKWARAAEAAYKKELDSNSPSKVFMGIGEDTVLGYNLGILNLGKTTKGIVSSWAESFTSVSPVMSFAVDTSALRYYTSDSFAREITETVSANNRYTVDNSFSIESMKDAVMQALVETGLVEDVRRQADKKEQTIVQIGNRTVSDAVTTQQRANGYVFAR